MYYLDHEYITKAYEILDPDIHLNHDDQQQPKSKTTTSDVDNFSQSLYVECAEKAISVRIFSFLFMDFFRSSYLLFDLNIKLFNLIFFKFQQYKIANRCLKIYFTLPTIANQFLARAYMCQFELLAPKRTEELDNLEKSIPYLFKAIEFAKQNKRFLIFLLIFFPGDF